MGTVPARLEDLTPGALVEGVDGAAPVTAVAVSWHGSDTLTLTYRDREGRVGERLLYRDDEASLRLAKSSGPWGFDADGHLFRLASEARRVRMAHLFDPMLAVHLSSLEPLPHQIEAVYGEMLPRQPLRFLLADDPGAGKTIMAGLYAKELMLRGDLQRCLVIAPGGLTAQWQDELAEKFDLEFDILSRDLVETSRRGNPFAERDLMIARLDQLARNEDLTAKLGETEWDLVIVDEAHRMSAQFFGNEVKETRRYQLGRLVSGLCRHFLLMTATPHTGKQEDFQLFLALLDPDRFAGRPRRSGRLPDASDLMRRMVKEDLLRFDGRPLFPERHTSTVTYQLTESEADLYERVSRYVREEMNRADQLAAEGEGRKGNRVGFALTVLQRRLASSPEAIYQSLRRRRERLEKDLQELRRYRSKPQRPEGAATATDEAGEPPDDPDEFDELPESERLELESRLVDGASAARTVEELAREIGVLRELEHVAGQVRQAGADRKWVEFSALLQDAPEMSGPDGQRRKLLVFTEHRDTLSYLVERLRVLLGRAEAVASIHGGLPREKRRAVQEQFSNDPDCVVLVATDAAGEGINLQRAHLVVNYDLPWNPNKIEQRFGRVHRIGQTEACHLWNLVAEDTREGQVYQRLLDKVETQRKALGGQVFDVLGSVMSGRNLRDLLLEAIRYGEQPEVRARIDEVVDERVGEGLSRLVEERALVSDVLAQADLQRIRQQMQEAEARRLQPHYVEAFFVEAFRRLGGRVAEREPGRYEITHVPLKLRSGESQGRRRGPVVRKYERVCFDKADLRVAGKPGAELLAPGHPLMEATVDAVGQLYGGTLKQGATLIDEQEAQGQPRVLVYLEHAITDGRLDSRGTQHVISRRFEFAELFADGGRRTATAAPYLDHRAATEEEFDATEPMRQAAWLQGDLEQQAVDVAIEQSVRAHLEEARARAEERVRRIEAAVHERLTHEISYWDQRANELQEEAEAGKQPRMNPERARARADELAARLDRRMEELAKERQIKALPPVVVGAALVVPTSQMEQRTEPEGPPERALSTEEVERRAVDAVLALERQLGRWPEEQPHHNPGFDIKSYTDDGNLRFLEVKGRLKGARTVTVTRNEILHGLNTPDRYILALVEVDPERGEHVRYLERPFGGISRRLHFAETSTNFDWAKLWDAAKEPL